MRLSLATLIAGGLLLAGCEEDMGRDQGNDEPADEAAPRDMSEPPDRSEIVYDLTPFDLLPPRVESDLTVVKSTDMWTGMKSGCVEGVFGAYYGNLHAHTSYSDGEGTPDEAFPYARDTAKLDFFFLTDHVEQEWLPFPIDKWGKCRKAAGAANVTGKFAASCGFEYGSGYSGITSTGHNNVFFADALFPLAQINFHDFYKSLAGCAKCVGQFNHPGDDNASSWNGFEYDPAADAQLHLLELNGAGPAWSLFFAALDKGWHVSPALNQDNHSKNWGTANESRTGLFLRELSLPAISEAMFAHRSFATKDRNATIRMMAGTCWMGSQLAGYPRIDITVEAQDTDAKDGYAMIELYGPGQTLLKNHPCGGAQKCTAVLSVDVKAPTYVVARAIQSDGDFVVAAPIWGTP